MANGEGEGLDNGRCERRNPYLYLAALEFINRTRHLRAVPRQGLRDAEDGSSKMIPENGP